MSTPITFNGSGYIIPAVGDASWGTNVSNYLIAISTGTLQKAGGAFTLSAADVAFGANFGLQAIYYKSNSANIAASGVLRLANTDSIGWRNAANSADLLLSVNTSNALTFAGTALAAAGNYLTALTGDVTATGPGSVAATVVQVGGALAASVASAATAVAAAVSTASANTLALRNSSGNAGFNNIYEAFVQTVTSAGTTTLTVASAYQQYFSGSTTQTVVLPVVSTLGIGGAGQQFSIVNLSTGVVTVNSSGANLVQSMPSNTAAIFTAIATSGTTAAAWSVTFTPLTFTGSGSSVLATSPTLTNPVQAGYEDFTEIATPSSPGSGVLRVYSKSGDALYFKNSAGTETQIGSGSGQKNYLQASASTVTGWTAVAGTGATTQATVTLSTDLTGNSPRPQTTKTSLKMVATAASGGTPVAAFAWATFQLDPADYNTKLQLQFAQNTASYTSNDYQVQVVCSASAFTSPTISSGTRLPLSTDSSSVSGLPNLEGTYRTTFDAPGSATPYIMVMFIPKTTATSTLYVSDLIVGPGTSVQGAAFQDLGLVTNGLTTAGFGTLASSSVKYWRVGTLLKAEGQFAAGTTVSAVASITLPFSLTVDGAVNAARVAGKWWNDNATASTRKTSILNYNPVANSAIITFGNDDYTTASAPDGNLPASSVGSSSATIFFTYEVPIAQWAGSGTVNLAYTANPTSEVRVGTSNGYGSTNTTIRRFTNTLVSIGQDITYADSASLGATFTVGATGIYAITYTDEFSAGASMGISLNSSQLTTNIATINAADRLCMYSVTAANDTGLVSVTVKLSAGDVLRAHTDATTSGSSVVRATFTITKVAVDAGQAVGFAAVVPGISAGLVPAAGLPGNTTGNAIAAGSVGEQPTKQTGTVTATTTLANFASMSLTPGIWILSASASAFAGAALGTYIQLAIATSSGNSTAGCTAGYDNVYGSVNASQGSGQAVIPAKYVIVPPGSNVSYYLNGRSDHTTSIDIDYFLQAVRIA